MFKKTVCVCLCLGLAWLTGVVGATAACDEDLDTDTSAQTFAQFQKAQSDLWDSLEQSGAQVDFSELVEGVLNQSYEQQGQMLLEDILDACKETVKEQWTRLVKLFLLGILSAFFIDLSSPLLKTYVGEMGYYAIYAAMLMILLVAFQDIYTVALDSVNVMFQTVRVLVPVFVAALVLAAQYETAFGVYTLVLSAIGAVEWVVVHVIFPVSYFYFALQMLNYSVKEERFSRLAAYLKQVVVWVLRLMFGLITGMQIVQCLLLPVSDQARNSNFSKSLAAIPGLGASARALTNTLFQSAVVVKSAIGVAGMLLIVSIVLFPLAKLLGFILSYQLLAALLQPIANKRLSALISAAAQSVKLLFQGLVTSTALFLVCIAIVTAATNGGGV